MNEPTKTRRGFAAMDPARVREISRMGGLAVVAAGTGHRFTKDEAAAAGRKGGLATHAKRLAARGAPFTSTDAHEYPLHAAEHETGESRP